MMLVMIVLIIGTGFQTVIVNTSEDNNYYPVKIIYGPSGYLDSAEVVNRYGNASTFDNLYEVNDYIINYGVKLIINPYLISYYDNGYHYKLSIIDPNSLNSLTDVANVIKTSKIAIIATPQSSYYMLYDPGTHSLIVESKIYINNNLLIDRYIGYYDYDHYVPPDNSSTRFIIVAAHASALHYKSFWKEFSNSVFGPTMQVTDHTVSEGLYSIDAVIAIDSYPIILTAYGQQYVFYPLFTPYPCYWPLDTSQLFAWNIGSYIGKFIHYLFSYLQQKYNISSAYYNALTSFQGTDDELQYCYIFSFWEGPDIDVPPYSGHPRIILIFNSDGGDVPVVKDDPAYLPPCPPGSPYCSIPLGNPSHKFGLI